MPEALPISVIIPCWRDEASLARLLEQLSHLAREQRHTLQLIVVDAASSSACRTLCTRHGAQWLTAQPCRGEQLRQGAAAARHPILWFVHADSTLVGNPLAAIRAAIDAGASGGYFTFRFANARSWQSRVLEPLIGLRCRLGVPYGDQGLFAQAGAYHDSGQHRPWPLFEEVELVKALRRQGRFVCLREGIRVDARRWQRDGWWRRSLRNRLLALGYCCGMSPNHLARRYSGQ